MQANEREITIRDAITAGLLKANKDDIREVIPQNNPETRETTYLIRGNIDKALRKISENFPVGSRDALEGIKACRSAIFLFKGGQR